MPPTSGQSGRGTRGSPEDLLLRKTNEARARLSGRANTILLDGPGEGLGLQLVERPARLVLRFPDPEQKGRVRPCAYMRTKEPHQDGVGYRFRGWLEDS